MSAERLRSTVRGVGACLPPRVIANAEMATIVDTTDEWIVQRTGIRQRHVAGDGETTSTLATRAAEAALANAGLKPADIDLIVVATSSPDYTFPAVATQVQGIQSQLLSLANLSYQGNYVFAGTATQTVPYVLDSNSPSGVTYQGNSGVNNVTLGSQFSLQTNLPGSQLFSASGNDVFQSIQNLITSLQSGNGIGAAVTEVGNASNYIDAQKVFYGNALNQLTAQQTYLAGETTQLAQQENTVGAADLPNVISNLTTAQTSLQATLEAIGQTANTNLFQYLK